jgi:hypothetical protein
MELKMNSNLYLTLENEIRKELDTFNYYELMLDGEVVYIIGKILYEFNIYDFNMEEILSFLYDKIYNFKNLKS